MKFKIKYSDQIVGLFSILAILALILLIFSLGIKQKWFTPKNTYTSSFLTATNLSEGMPIIYKGFTIGQIKKITLTKEQTVDINFYILNDYFDLVTYGSILELVVSPIGLGKQLLFHPGTSQDLLPVGSLIPRKDSTIAKLLIKNGFASIPQQEDTISSLVGMVSDLLAGLNKTITEVNGLLAGKNTAALGQSIDSLSVVLKNAELITKELGVLSTKISDPTGLVPTLLKSDSSISTLFSDKNKLYDNVNSILKNVDATILDVNKITTSIKGEVPQVGTILTEVNGILSEVEVLLLQVQDVMEGLKNNPLLKDGIPNKLEKASSTPVIRSSDF